jgi:hypothetical protein
LSIFSKRVLGFPFFSSRICRPLGYTSVQICSNRTNRMEIISKNSRSFFFSPPTNFQNFKMSQF